MRMGPRPEPRRSWRSRGLEVLTWLAVLGAFLAVPMLLRGYALG